MPILALLPLLLTAGVVALVLLWLRVRTGPSGGDEIQACLQPPRKPHSLVGKRCSTFVPGDSPTGTHDIVLFPS